MKKKQAKSGGGIQSGLHAFFKPPGSFTPMSSQQNKTEKTPPTSPENSITEDISIDCNPDHELTASKKRKIVDPYEIGGNKKRK